MPKRTAPPPEAVDEFMAALSRPHKPDIAEGIEWNAPSWRMTEHFATMHLGSEGLDHPRVTGFPVACTPITGRAIGRWARRVGMLDRF